jgi:outer membrane protein assembly factor BamA
LIHSLIRRTARACLGVIATAAAAGAQVTDSTKAPAPAPPPTAATARDGQLSPPLVVPAIYYTPETRLALGLGVLAVTMERDPAQRPGVYSANVTATMNGQYTLAFASDVWTRGNALRIETDASAQRYPNRFYGLGNQTPNTIEKYTPTTLAGSFGVQKAVRPGWYLGTRLSVDRTSLTDLSPTGAITTFPERDGWTLVTIGVSAVIDTRNKYFAPTGGTVTTLSVARSDRALGSELPSTRWVADWRGYMALHAQGTLAVQLRGDAVVGEAPFERLPALGGGSLLRGYFAGRFRDKSLAIGQAEYRLGPWWDQLVGLTFFVGAGSVAPSVRDLTATQYHVAGGGGVRVILNPATGMALRVDYGQARGSRGLYISVGEAF